MIFKTIPLTDSEKQKVARDIQFIKLMAIAAAPLHCRLIVSGGYAVDGSLGLVTRLHRDLDLQIFGSADGVGVVNKLFQKLKDSFPDLKITDEGRELDYHLFKLSDGHKLKVEIYYIQTLETPFDSVKITIRKDDSQSEPGKFDTIVATLEDVIFEAISVEEVLNDLISKKKEGESQKHGQDIENLNLLLSKN